MRKTLFYILFLIFFASEAQPQSFSGRISSGYGNFKMNSLRNLQLEMKEKYSFLGDVQDVTSFPPYLFYSTSWGYNFKGGNIIGLDASFYSSGARNHLADYSGYYCNDYYLNGYAVGIYYQNYFSGIKNAGFLFELRAGNNFSTLRNEITLEVYDQFFDSEEKKFSSSNLYLEPALGYYYFFSNSFGINLLAGYEMNFNGGNFKDKEGSPLLLEETNKGVSPEWTGLRIRLGAFIMLTP